jgi:adenylate cyclase
MAHATFYGFLFPFIFMAFMVGPRMGYLNCVIAATAVSLISGPGITLIFHVVIPASRRLPFLAAVLLQFAGFLFVGMVGFFVSISVVGSISQKMSLLSPELWRATWTIMTTDLLSIYPWVAILAAVFIGGAQVSRKLGPGVLFGWITGKYHKPREETLIFMFLDVKDSTPLAEQLGNLKFSELIQDFFADMALPLQAMKGDVSHYIGDEAVITWRPERGLKNASCVRFFFEVEKVIAANEAKYRAKFGIVPTFKAGIHMGTVVAAEVGVAKSEIVYHGDAVNTTARVVGLCAGLGRDLLVSKEVRDALGSCGFEFESMGEQAMKGKAEPMEVFAVCSPQPPNLLTS